jgi:hypothetical protein
VTRVAAPSAYAAQQAAVDAAAQVAFVTLNPEWILICTDGPMPVQRERMRRWERNRLLGRRAQEALAEENDGTPTRRCQAVEARARSALVRRRHPGPRVPQPPAPHAWPSRCPGSAVTAAPLTLWRLPHRIPSRASSAATARSTPSKPPAPWRQPRHPPARPAHPPRHREPVQP